MEAYTWSLKGDFQHSCVTKAFLYLRGKKAFPACACPSYSLPPDHVENSSIRSIPKKGNVMDTNSRGTLVPRPRAQKLGMLFLLLSSMTGLVATSFFFQMFTPAYAAGTVQINAGGPAAAPFVADTDFA
jgi:hypothetical protein